MDENLSLGFSVLTLMQEIPDPRGSRGKRYPLYEILTIALLAYMSGCESFIEIEEYGEDNKDFFATFLPLKHGIPSHDTTYRTFSIIDKKAFEEALAKLAQLLGCAVRITALKEAINNDKTDAKHEQYCIDGKTLRGSLSRKDNTAVHTVNVYSTETGLCIRTLATNGKGKELEATRQVLEKLNLKGVVVSLDALGCQRDIALYIGSRGGFFMLNAKENQPGLYRDIQQEFERGKCKIETAQTQERTRGREETRTIQVVDDINTCMSLGWIGVRQIYQIKRVVVKIKSGEKTEETVYGITNLTSDQTTALELLSMARAHWGVENNLHRTLDVLFHEDACQVRSKNVATNLATLRRMAHNLIKVMPDEEGGKRTIKSRVRRCARDNEYIAKVFQFNMVSENA